MFSRQHRGPACILDFGTGGRDLSVKLSETDEDEDRRRAECLPHQEKRLIRKRLVPYTMRAAQTIFERLRWRTPTSPFGLPTGFGSRLSCVVKGRPFTLTAFHDQKSNHLFTTLAQVRTLTGPLCYYVHGKRKEQKSSEDEKPLPLCVIFICNALRAGGGSHRARTRLAADPSPQLAAKLAASVLDLPAASSSPSHLLHARKPRIPFSVKRTLHAA